MPLTKDSPDLVSGILNKTWDELEAFESDGETLFPEELIRRKGKDWEKIPVLLKVPREPVFRAARIQARKWAIEEGLDPSLDPELFDNMDSMCVLSMCIRNVSPPHEPWEPFPKELESRYDRPCLDALWAKLDAYRTVIDPRPNDVSEEQLLMIIAAVARAKNIVPLAAFAGQSQNNCVVSMAVRLNNLLASK